MAAMATCGKEAETDPMGRGEGWEGAEEAEDPGVCEAQIFGTHSTYVATDVLLIITVIFSL